jgi:hypothetical protein
MGPANATEEVLAMSSVSLSWYLLSVLLGSWQPIRMSLKRKKYRGSNSPVAASE